MVDSALLNSPSNFWRTEGELRSAESDINCKQQELQESQEELSRIWKHIDGWIEVILGLSLCRIPFIAVDKSKEAEMVVLNTEITAVEEKVQSLKNESERLQVSPSGLRISLYQVHLQRSFTNQLDDYYETELIEPVVGEADVGKAFFATLDHQLNKVNKLYRKESAFLQREEEIKLQLEKPITMRKVLKLH